MSPFRDAPQVELGPLDVGLGKLATKAMRALPRGGRVVSLERSPIGVHIAGTLGSVGLFVVATTAFVAVTSNWRPVSPSDFALCLAGVVAGGLSLATIFRAMDRAVGQLTRPGEIIGRGARRILRRIARLAAHAERAPDEFRARRVAALQRALLSAAEPEIARWIPAEVRGRGELVLARAETRLGGPGWAGDEALRRRVRALLVSAAGRLTDPAPAEADLAALDRAPLLRRSAPKRRSGPRVAAERAAATRSSIRLEAHADDEAYGEVAPRAALAQR
jgi:hypothetical protein